jgi:hypothetical protein
VPATRQLQIARLQCDPEKKQFTNAAAAQAWLVSGATGSVSQKALHHVRQIKDRPLLRRSFSGKKPRTKRALTWQAQ